MFQEQKNWRELNSIKSQIWAVDALCAKLLHLRDCQQLLSMQDYLDILNDFLAKLKLKL